MSSIMRQRSQHVAAVGDVYKFADCMDGGLFMIVGIEPVEPAEYEYNETKETQLRFHCLLEDGTVTQVKALATFDDVMFTGWKNKLTIAGYLPIARIILPSKPTR